MAALYPADARELIAGTAGCSPYLAGLLRQETAWCAPALDAPEAALDAVLAGLVSLTAPAADLRRAKRRVALLVALADLGGVWSLTQVTSALTRLADAATQAAFGATLEPELRRGKLPGMTPHDLASGAGLIVLAMGKMGAYELNYSSDIDLICLFDDSRFDDLAVMDARAAYIRATRKASALLSEMTGDGYVFRTDLRLRPDPAVTPVCVPISGAETYYESMGRTWERAAYIKARPCAGDLAAGEAFITHLRPFVWRKHLDFAAIQDAHDMRLRIRDHKGFGGALTLDGHDIKLGRGGIREIEFYAQTRQLIAGGRDPALRERGTCAALERLTAAGWVPAETADRLITQYHAHREIEHRVQMVRDAQTQKLPSSEEGWARLAAFQGCDVASLQRDIAQRCEEVHALTEDFFAPDATAAPEPEFGTAVAQSWLDYPALRSPRAAELFQRIRPGLLDKLSQASDPDAALTNFDGFLRGLPAGVQLFALFEANPQLLDMIVDICGTAPRLAAYLSRHSAVFDAVIGGAFFAAWPGADAMEAEMAEAVAQDDYEAALRALRRVQREWKFRIGVHYLRGLIAGAEAGRQYADLASATVRALWPRVCAEFAVKHGPAPGRGACVLGMGSLGAGRLHDDSDLDLLVIYDAAGAEASEGRRPLATRPYFSRLTQAMITALSAQMAEGSLYEVDMRLRPSGRSGPVAVSLDSFRSYQRTEAWTWEHLALTRARVVAGDAGLAADIEAERCAVIQAKASGATICADVAEMRDRIAQAKGPGGPFAGKLGKGRLQDIELYAQSLALRAGSGARATLDQLDGAPEVLRQGAALFWELQCAGRLLTEGELDPAHLGAGAQGMILRLTGAGSLQEAQAASVALAARCDEVITQGVADGECD